MKIDMLLRHIIKPKNAGFGDTRGAFTIFRLSSVFSLSVLHVSARILLGMLISPATKPLSKPKNKLLRLNGKPKQPKIKSPSLKIPKGGSCGLTSLLLNSGFFAPIAEIRCSSQARSPKSRIRSARGLKIAARRQHPRCTESPVGRQNWDRLENREVPSSFLLTSLFLIANRPGSSPNRTLPAIIIRIQSKHSKRLILRPSRKPLQGNPPCFCTVTLTIAIFLVNRTPPPIVSSTFRMAAFISRSARPTTAKFCRRASAKSPAHLPGSIDFSLKVRRPFPRRRKLP
jgi:hypothetical protein